MMSSPPVAIRPLVDDDWNWVLKSWKRSYRDSEKLVPAHIYFAEIDSRIRGYRVKAEFRVACDPTETDFILGWACCTPDVVHYVHVRESYQRAGVARKLVGRDKVIATHWTKSSEDIAMQTDWLKYAPSRR